MYLAEVLGKLPVVQHFLFGSILPYEGPPSPSEKGADDAHSGHSHGARPDPGKREAGWGDCCGIPVPSAFGAAKAEASKRPEVPKLSGPGIRPVPFD